MNDERKTTPGDADAAPESGHDTRTGARGNTPRPGGAVELGGRKGPEPTRYGDWEKAGRCIDF